MSAHQPQTPPEPPGSLGVQAAAWPPPAGPRLRTRLTPARLRAWLNALLAVLLVALYLVAQHTYTATHLPPPRFQVLAPGAVAHGTWADFRLLSLTRTDRWGTESDDEAGEPQPGAEWVVARLEVTPRHRQDIELCQLLLAVTDGRTWEPASFDTPTHEGLSCVPEEPPAQTGVTYPVVVAYEVPSVDVDDVAGLALDPFSWRRYQLLRPPA
ncbi:hypothetical protein [Microlunatus flavus]|uniref:DUF4352 domain-containing protein n=1 Tax=Microlunatus flavus TaxID=1036181 RepID=A0A1H9AWC9_9ACTN|nr:hypothetical protein [Microlunatus flavus]SEP80787.1 hypothetical protein SAMN05421756_101748 [Microlunatus flavus]